MHVNITCLKAFIALVIDNPVHSATHTAVYCDLHMLLSSGNAENIVTGVSCYLDIKVTE